MSTVSHIFLPFSSHSVAPRTYISCINICLASTDYLKLCTHNLSLVASWGHSPKPLLGYAQTLLTSSEMERPYGLAKAGVVASLKAVYSTIDGIAVINLWTFGHISVVKINIL